MKIPPKKKVLIIGLENTLVSKSVQSAEVLYEKIDIKMNIRPSADSFINIMSCFYELAIYSCYSSEFIKDILEIIDPKNIVKIILSKCDCYNFGDGNYLKDIRKVSNSMKDVVIVDSSMYCFALCRRNGLFISPYNGSSKDKELQSLGQFLMEISAVDDIRIEIKKKHPFLEMLGDFS
jgi:TFIIF-interacting CTD phosphatase-like protein